MAKSRHPRPDQTRPREDCKGRNKRPQVPQRRRSGQVADATVNNLDLNGGANTAVLLVTPNTAKYEYINFVDIHKDDGGNPGDWVGSMWFDDYVGGGPQERWHAAEYDFIEGEPITDETYWAVCYVSAYYTDEGSAVAS